MKKVLATFLFCIFAICVQSQEEYTSFGFRVALGGSTMKGMDNYERKMIIPGSNLKTIHPYRSAKGLAYDFGTSVQFVKNRFMIQGDAIYSELNTRVANGFTKEYERVKV